MAFDNKTLKDLMEEARKARPSNQPEDNYDDFDDDWLEIPEEPAAPVPVDPESCIRETLLDKGYQMPVISNTNQVFAALPNDMCRKLEMNFTFSPWEKWDEAHTVVRFCTSWATTEESVEALCEAIRNS